MTNNYIAKCLYDEHKGNIPEILAIYAQNNLHF